MFYGFSPQPTKHCKRCRPFLRCVEAYYLAIPLLGNPTLACSPAAAPKLGLIPYICHIPK